MIDIYFSGWLDYKGEIVETVDAGDDVVVIIHEVARLRDSDAVLERDVAHIWTFREGKSASQIPTRRPRVTMT